VARYVELRRHTDSDGDALSEEGVRAALEIGRRLTGPYVPEKESGRWNANEAERPRRRISVRSPDT
jgi:hypothetical protein